MFFIVYIRAILCYTEKNAEKWSKHMIVFDLEWNQGYAPGAIEEIIQIGAVRLSALGGRVEGSFNAYIHPQLRSGLSVGAKKLPDLALSLRSRTDFPTAYRAFLDFCGGDTLFASWGPGDLGVLRKNAAHWHLSAPPAAEQLDLQAAFGRMVGADRCIALEQAVDYCAIPDVFSYHNALNDALYTALVGEHLSAASLVAPPPKPRQKPPVRRAAFSALPKPAEPFHMNFSERMHAPSNRRLRSMPCPVCGATMSTALWYPGTADTFFAAFTCGGHGRWLCRLRTQELKPGWWQAERVLLDPTEETLAAFSAAKQKAPIRCTGAGKRKHSRFRRRRTVAKEVQPYAKT